MNARRAEVGTRGFLERDRKGTAAAKAEVPGERYPPQYGATGRARLLVAAEKTGGQRGMNALRALFGALQLYRAVPTASRC
jgi:hypothetical protein